jgi:glycosyltransferase involved in cell wall biosynthesis
MSAGKIVLITMPFDQVDILEDFLDWHLDLGVDLILALDGGSTDGTTAVLERYKRTKRVAWFPLPERDMTKYSVADELTTMARDRYDADWIIYCDVDEFLCAPGKSLREVLAECDRDGITLINVPRRNMTGPLIAPGRRATEVLTLRIDREVVPTPAQEATWDFPVPFVFLQNGGGHVAVRASAMKSFAIGMHSATVTWGSSGTSELYILHYGIRGFEELQQKVRNIRKWFEDNPHLPRGWGWHWRRWIQLEDAGRLREDYEYQFVSDQRADELVADGTCTVDMTIADWLVDRKTRPAPARARASVPTNWRGRLQQLVRAWIPGRP